MKCTITPIITGPTETVKNVLNKNLEAKQGKYSIDSQKKKKKAAVLLGTSDIMRKILQCGTERWGSPSVQEKYQDENACDKHKRQRNNNNNNAHTIC
jgi:hypothetical protein